VKIFATDVDQVSSKDAGRGLIKEIRCGCCSRVIGAFFCSGKWGALQVGTENFAKPVVLRGQNVLAIRVHTVDLISCETSHLSEGRLQKRKQTKVMTRLHFRAEAGRLYVLGRRDPLGDGESSFRRR